ncbi:MAG: thioredoxin domain-containing protein [Candidatus Binatia bacterium]|nr:thioredoxin domain-containing protein [Candidatus Binatia bacterium]
MELNPQRKKALLVLAVGLVGTWIAYQAEVVHRQLKTDAGFTSFCNVNQVVNCDVVLSSRWSELGGFSVSLLATVFYVSVSVLALAAFMNQVASVRRRIAGALVVLAVAGLGFSVYMAVVSFGVLRAVCVLCTGLYLVGLANFVAAWRLHRSLLVASRVEQALALRRDLWLYVGAVVAALTLIGSAVWDAWRYTRQPDSVDELVRTDPRFVEWFQRLARVEVPVDTRNSRGPANAAVTIVEFSDFECVHCAALHKALQETWLRSPTMVRVVFRHFPLDSACNPLVGSRFHPVACDAAVAAECAGEQGKFWQYHDRLFDHQRQLDGELLDALARQLGLDMPSFRRCMQDPNIRRRVQDDIAVGMKLGVNSTPTMFLNGRMVKGALDAATLQRALVLARDSGS